MTLRLYDYKTRRQRDYMPSPLEQFLIEYVDAVGGLADEIEPQVYDVLLPDAATPQRIAFDPDALPEHPSAQLLTFGSALLDDLLARAQTRGQIGLAFLDDAHLQPHALAQRIARDLVVPETVTLRIENIRRCTSRIRSFGSRSLIWETKKSKRYIHWRSTAITIAKCAISTSF